MLEVVSVKNPSYGFLLCVCVSLLWGASNSSRDRLPPDNVSNVTIVTQTMNSITLEWNKVNNITTYTLRYEDNGDVKEDNITASSAEMSVKHVVSSLNAGRRYWFTIITEFENLSSTGFNFTAVTTPQNTKNVKAVTQNESSITLQWNKVNNITTYTLRYEDNGGVKEENITASSAEKSVKHVVSPLNAGRRYRFTIITEFENLSSTGFNFTAVTTPQNTENVSVLTQNESSITLQWNKVNNILTYTLRYEDNGDVKGDNITASSAEKSVKHVVSPLNAGRRYRFTIITKFEKLSSTGVNFTAVTAPQNTKNVKAVTQNESSITLQWNKVNNITTYTLRYEDNGGVKEENITASSAEKSVKHVVSPLNAGRRYRFTIITEFENLSSTGFNFTAVTVPLAVESITVSERSVNAVTLTWKHTNQAWAYNVLIDERHESVSTDTSSETVSHSVKGLQPGTKYTINVITTFSGFNSSPSPVVTVTAIDCSRVNWHINSTSIQGTVEGLFTSATATNSTVTHNSTQIRIVSFTDLYPGASYEITLEYLDRNISDTALTQCNHSLLLPPSSIVNAHCDYWGSGYSIRVVWDAPYGLWTHVEVNVTGENVLVSENDKRHTIINGFQPAQTYGVSVSLRYEERMSERAFVFDCSTDPRGVIAGSVMAVLIFIILVCAAAFIFLKKPNLMRKNPFIGDSKLSQKKDKAIPITKFPDHFALMSLDEDRGFGEEYENLSPVGTEQTQRVATLPENKDKNRFSNVLPYDWNRVKLNTFTSNEGSDYINASYMPGYNSNREFIATQGPLPSTVNDFWRMIWEQRVKGIVMVTNCNERGKIKCEKYWPDRNQSLLYGEQLVTHRYEQQDINWTLREFSLKHKSTSEERTLKHFHFTVWPDHGVPQGTEILILFRELMRQHIEREATGTPTVVHCSAGVGRTGTIIALDVLLQQLQKERAVGINAFVHKMRLHRPHMVQTESQYVFLHQCIMDYLQPTQRSNEGIYENVDTIYVNATALKELR
ncbi:receptor-type tyrosine-protein phosphatase H-like isoform X2 [Gouania willdenowi]|nr:receptor-type tyrosine-protein phosphatase H isoform X2 [Gouania willdenowi]